MAVHDRKIHRLYRSMPTNSTFATIYSELISSFFGAGTLVGTTDKWTFFGELRAVLSRYTTGGGGMRYPFELTKTPGVSTGILVLGTPSDLVGISSTIVQPVLLNSSTLFGIQTRSDVTGSSSIVLVELEGIFTGGPGPAS